MNDTLSFLSDETINEMKIYISYVIELMKKNLDFDMGLREYIGILAKKIYQI